jgi:superfamily II DNA or RNA helicase
MTTLEQAPPTTAGLFHTPWSGLLDFQAEGVAQCFYGTDPESGADGGMFLLFDTGCLYGDAEIMVNRGGKGFRVAIRDVVRKFNGGKTHGPKWDLSIPTFVTREVDGVVRLGRLTGAWESGVKITYTVTTDTGRTIRATDEHPFLTERGWLRLDQLVVGDEVHVRGSQATGHARKPKPRYRSTAGLVHHPYATHRRAKNSPYRVVEHRLVAEAAMNHLAYERYVERLRIGQIDGLCFLDPDIYAVHHIDHNHLNNELVNLKIMTHSEHQALHADEGKTNSVLYKIVTEKITSVELFGEESTYDLAVEDDPHNFLANGFVVHNTGKTVCSIALACLLIEDQKIDRVIVACEKSKLTDWVSDFQSFSELSVRKYHGSSRKTMLTKHDPLVVVSTYETLRADLMAFQKNPGKRGRGSRVDGPLMDDLGLRSSRTLWIFDEVTKLKGRGSQIHRAFDYALGQARKHTHQRVIGLTATPVERDFEDFYNLGRLVVPSRMPTVEEFEKRYTRGKDILGRYVFVQYRAREFAALFSPVLIRKRKTDPDVIEQFPKMVEQTIGVDLHPQHRQFYDATLSLFDDPEDLRAFGIARMTAGHPCSHLHADNPVSRSIVETVGEEFLRSVPSSKSIELINRLTPLVKGQGAQVIVFTFYGRSVLVELAKDLRAAGFTVSTFAGGMTTAEQDKAKTEFTSGATEVFLASDAGARGLNLGNASYVIEFESAMNYAMRTQRFNRASRLSSTATSVTCWTMICQATIEVPLFELCMRRNADHDIAVGDEADDTAFIPASERRRMLTIGRG